jgi:hypothetical protein
VKTGISSGPRICFPPLSRVLTASVKENLDRRDRAVHAAHVHRPPFLTYWFDATAARQALTVIATPKIVMTTAEASGSHCENNGPSPLNRAMRLRP